MNLRPVYLTLICLSLAFVFSPFAFAVGVTPPPPPPPPPPATPPPPPPTPPATPPSTTPPTSNPTPPATTKTNTDKIPPVITDIVVSNISVTEATVSWKTNEPANSSIQYGLTSSYGDEDNVDSKNTEHSFVLTGLEDGKVYYFKVSNTDAAGNVAQSEEKTFTTLKLGKSELETMPIVEKESSYPWLPLVGLVGLGLILGLVIFFWKKKKKKDKESSS